MSAGFDQALGIATRKHMDGDREGARDLYHKLICVDPHHPFLNFAIGTFYTDTDQSLALPFLIRAIDLDPQNAQAWNNLGACYKACNLHVEAEKTLLHALELAPENPAAYANLSGIFINEGCPERAIEWAEKGLAIDPTSPQLNNHLALACLESGDWARAWPHWENRTRLAGWFTREFPESVKLWDGQPVKTLVLSGEQGIGDEILFASIVPECKADRVIIECTQRLQTLFERSFPGCTTYPSHQDVLFHEHDIDAHLQLGSLPRLFRSTPDACPGTPFLKPDPLQVAEFRARLARLGPPPYVGLAWHGGTHKTHAHARTVPLRAMAPVAAVEDCTFVSVQYGIAAAEAGSCGLPHWSDAVIDFDRHTALIAACDLVISVCQTAVHQAGGLGVPCWCLTPVKVAWRYGTFGGERMPWYNSVRLLRQQKSDDWGELIERTAVELHTWIAANAALKDLA